MSAAPFSAFLCRGHAACNTYRLIKKPKMLKLVVFCVIIKYAYKMEILWPANA